MVLKFVGYVDEFMEKVLTKLEIQAENNVIQNEKVAKIDVVEISLENLSGIVF